MSTFNTTITICLEELFVSYTAEVSVEFTYHKGVRSCDPYQPDDYPELEVTNITVTGIRELKGKNAETHIKEAVQFFLKESLGWDHNTKQELEEKAWQYVKNHPSI